MTTPTPHTTSDNTTVVAEYDPTNHYHVVFTQAPNTRISIIFYYTPQYPTRGHPIIRVLDTSTTTRFEGLLNTMVPHRRLHAFLKDKEAVLGFLREFITAREGSLGALAYAVDSWAQGADTSTLTNIPLGVTGIAQWNEKLVGELVTGLVKAIDIHQGEGIN